MAGYVRSRVVPSLTLTRGGARGWGWYHRALKKMNAAPSAPVQYDDAMPAPTAPRPQAYLDISIGGSAPQRVVVELAQDVVPKTVENFVKLCTEGVQVQVDATAQAQAQTEARSFKHSKLHNVTKGVFIGGGDIVHSNGTGGHAALERGQRYFDDENFALQFSEPGVVGMANAGVDKNGSQFFIALRPLPHLNGRNVAFGKVVNGESVLKSIENVFCVRNKPVTAIEIVDCGVVAA